MDENPPTKTRAEQRAYTAFLAAAGFGGLVMLAGVICLFAAIWMISWQFLATATVLAIVGGLSWALAVLINDEWL